MAKDLNDFTEATKVRVFKRAGYRCSFPGCGITLVGPHSDEESGNAVSTGEIAHISGARPAANNRYQAHLQPDQRSHHSNAIALCRTHAKLIDSDEDKYTIEVICAWKAGHEDRIARLQAGEKVDEEYNKSYDKCSDEELVNDRLYRRGLINKESAENLRLSLFLFAFAAASAAIMYFLHSFVFDFGFYIFILGVAFVLFPSLVGFNILDGKSEFVRRQEEAIKEINYRLKERGVE